MLFAVNAMTDIVSLRGRASETPNTVQYPF